MKQIRILAVDDHPVFREGLNLVISSQADMVVVGQANCAQEALDQFRLHRPDLTLMDVHLTGPSGTAVLIEIRKEFPSARVMMLTTSDADAEIQRALNAGAISYVLKSAPRLELLKAIRSSAAGRKYIPTEVASAMFEHLGQELLSARETEVLGLIRDGTRNKRIAAKLGIAETTVNFHIKNIVEKLGANDRAHAVSIALKRGLIQF